MVSLLWRVLVGGDRSSDVDQKVWLLQRVW